MDDFMNDFYARQLPSARAAALTGAAQNPLAELNSARTILVRALSPSWRVNGALVVAGKCYDAVAADAVKLIAAGEAERAE
jgi:hypothetical protein